jgi:DNA phosphorothioation-associated putative methyltransferase
LVQKALPYLPVDDSWNIVKVVPSAKKVSFLTYPNFDTDPHPVLTQYMIVDLSATPPTIKTPRPLPNPVAILHRKELFITQDDPLYEMFATLTRQEAAAGLLDKKIRSKIGNKHFWERLLNRKQLTIIDHQLVRQPTKGKG